MEGDGVLVPEAPVEVRDPGDDLGEVPVLPRPAVREIDERTDEPAPFVGLGGGDVLDLPDGEVDAVDAEPLGDEAKRRDDAPVRVVNGHREATRPDAGSAQQLPHRGVAVRAVPGALQGDDRLLVGERRRPYLDAQTRSQSFQTGS